VEEPSAPARRIAGPNAKNRTVLCDAVERIVATEGAVAVTSRRVAAEAGLKPQLVHYYFASMDDLLVATFERLAEEGLAHQEAAAAGPNPLRTMWATLGDRRSTAVLVEFAALAAHRPELRAAIKVQAERFRSMLTAVVADAVARQALADRLPPPEAIAVFLTGVAQIMTMERGLDVSSGHEAVRATVDALLDDLEPLGS
jgi:AcrR family transcriptional regulator